MIRRRIRLRFRRLRASRIGRSILILCVMALPSYLISCKRAPNTASAAYGAHGSGSAPRIRLLWQIPSHGLKSVRFSPDGEFIGFVDDRDVARCYSSDGMLQWSREIPGIQQLLVGSGGEFSVAYTLLNPTRRDLYFLDRDGRIRWNPELRGAPWCVAGSEGSDQFVVGTGERYVYIFSVGEHRRRYVRWRPEGVPTSISFVPATDGLLIGTWQDASVGRYALDGSYEWTQPGEQDKLYFTQADEAGESVLSLAVPNRRIPRSILTMMDGLGNHLWSKELGGAEISASISRQGRCAAVGYTRYIEHNSKQVAEDHVAFYNEQGNMLWDKGGMFFKPRLIGALSPDGVLACDDNYVYVLDRSGKASAKEKLTSPLRNWWADRTRSRLLLLCENNRLYYYSVE